MALIVSCKQINTQLEPEIVSSLEITSFPKKMVYNKGDYFSSEGLSVRALFSNGEYKDDFPSVLSMPDGQRLMEAGEKSITVTVGDIKKSFLIIVNEKACTSIKITQSPKLIYVQGDVFDSTGIEVKKLYSDDTEEILSDSEYTLNPPNGTVLSEIKKVKLMVSVPGFSDYVDIRVFGVTEDDADNPQQWLYYTIENNEIAITGLAKNCTEKDIVIPEKIGGYPVTTIQNLSTYEYDKVTSSPMITLSIPSSVRTIAAEACYEIASLEKIYFSEGLETIESKAFAYCYGLRELHFPDSLVSINNRAFYSCISLESIEIPNEDCIIGELSFDDCSHLKNITVANMNDIYSSDGTQLSDFGAFGGTEHLNVLYTGSKNRIGGYFFSKAGVDKIVSTKNSLEVIGKNAFYKATVASDIIFEGIKTVEDNAFLDAEIDGDAFILPEGLQTIGSGAFKFYLYENKNKVKEMRIPSSVSYIGQDAFFWGLEKLVFACNLPDVNLEVHISSNCTIEFEEGVTEIGADVLSFRNGITKVLLPSTIERVGDRAFGFNEPAVLLNEAFDFPNLKYCAQDFAPSGKGEAVLYDMKKITGMYRENGWNLITIKGKFEDCAISAKTVVIDDSVTNDLLSSLPFGLTVDYDKNEKIYYLYSSSYIRGDCIVLGKGITEIPRGFWADVSDERYLPVKELIIRGDVKTIPVGCFYYSSLEKIVIPESVETIGESAFTGCNHLKSIVIPENVKTIGAYAFSCSGIETAAIPSTVETVGDGAFSGCKSLYSVEIGTSSVGTSMFENCKNLENVVFTNNVKVIQKNAFLNCDAIKEITIPSSVTQIDEQGGFSSCMGLTNVAYEGTVIPCQLGQLLLLKEITVKQGSDWETKFSASLKNMINEGKIKLTKN